MEVDLLGFLRVAAHLRKVLMQETLLWKVFQNQEDINNEFNQINKVKDFQDCWAAHSKDETTTSKIFT